MVGTSEVTIVTYNNKNNMSDWSEVWSTTHVPTMDTATGAGGVRRRKGRKRLRFGALAVGSLLTMHLRLAASAITGGLVLFGLSLLLSVVALGNPMRHFEVYLGQWSISGPGRAFRLLPLFDGIGIAICINALLRAIICCALAAIAAIYVVYSVNDAALPFTYCRDFNLNSYNPIQIDLLKALVIQQNNKLYDKMNKRSEQEYFQSKIIDVEVENFSWKNDSYGEILRQDKTDQTKKKRQIKICEETFKNEYPIMFSSPAYNFFFVEVAQLRDKYDVIKFNTPLIAGLIFVWTIIWILLISERIRYNRLIWNNIYLWILAVPWLWAAALSYSSAVNYSTVNRPLRKIFRMGSKGILGNFGDALEMVLYLHAAGVGTELIHGKGLNHFAAAGHVDPDLNNESIWHSVVLLTLSLVHCSLGTLCALADNGHSDKIKYDMRESILWTMPMYSKCTSLGNYSHLISTLVFSGLMFSYIAIGFVLIKTALHIIFEYKVTLVFFEQRVVTFLMMICIGLSLFFTANNGLTLLESLDAVMTGIATPAVCLLELLALLYVYRNSDFMSDANVATEENTCPSCVTSQWQVIPFVMILALVLKLATLVEAEMPTTSMILATIPIVAMAIAVPIRAGYNAYVFLRP